MMVLEKFMFLPVFILFINLFVSGLIINLIQLLLWICVRPGSPWLYQKLNYYLLYVLWTREYNTFVGPLSITLMIDFSGNFSEIVFIGEWWSSSTCAVLTDDDTWSKMGKEHAIVIMNHSFEVDWLMGWLVCEQSRLLAVSYINAK